MSLVRSQEYKLVDLNHHRLCAQGTFVRARNDLSLYPKSVLDTISSTRCHSAALQPHVCKAVPCLSPTPILLITSFLHYEQMFCSDLFGLE